MMHFSRSHALWALFLAACASDPVDPGMCTLSSDCAAGSCVDGRCTALTDGGILDVPITSEDAGSLDVMRADVGNDAGPPPLQEWILSVDNGDEFLIHRLVRISVAAEDYGDVSVVCEDIMLPDTVPAMNNISSLTFNNGQLYASGRGEDEGDTLLRINPCRCTAEEVGRYAYTRVAGIASDGAQDMFGVSTGEDVVFRFEPADATSTLLAELGSDWGTVGLTWSGAAADTLWGINGATEQLVEFSPADGSQIRVMTLDYSFGSVGMEYHPGVDKIFACSNPGELLVVDPVTGNVAVGPDMGIDDCNNLAAPFGEVECVL